MQSGKFGWIFNDFHEQKLKMWMLIPTHLDNHDYNTAKMRRTPWSISFRQVPRVVPCISRPKRLNRGSFRYHACARFAKGARVIG
jgi:hypothetical protein